MKRKRIKKYGAYDYSYRAKRAAHKRFGAAIGRLVGALEANKGFATVAGWSPRSAVFYSIDGKRQVLEASE